MLYWIMLNPSTADERKDDATIRRCVNFSRQWGFGGMEVYNLFAFRATCPDDLLAPGCTPIGEANDSYLRSIPEDGQIIAAWGAYSRRLGNRDKDVLLLLGNRSVKCLGVTANGYPKHPVRLANDTEREDYFNPATEQDTLGDGPQIDGSSDAKLVEE